MESKNKIFSLVAGSIWFCLSFLESIFLQVRFQISSYLWGSKDSGPVNVTQPVRYPINMSMMFFKWFIFGFTFWYFKGVNQRRPPIFLCKQGLIQCLVLRSSVFFGIFIFVTTNHLIKKGKSSKLLPVINKSNRRFLKFSFNR